MKKILLSALAVVALGTAAQAQEMKFGVKAGLNVANLGGDAETSGSRMGLHIGGVAEFMVAENFSIQPEVLYSMQGAKSETVDFETLDVVEEDLKLDYINIPIMAKYYVAEGFSIEAGPQVGFLMSAKMDDTDVKDNFKSIDFGLNGGIGYALDMGVFFQARYYIGLSSITEDVEIMGENVSVDTMNNMFQVSVGEKF